MEIQEILKALREGEVAIPSLTQIYSIEEDEDGKYDSLSGSRDKLIESENFTIEYSFSDVYAHIDDWEVIDSSVEVEVVTVYDADGNELKFGKRELEWLEKVLAEGTVLEIEA